MPSVTVILFLRFFELCEIGESACNYNLVKIFYKLQLLHKSKQSQMQL